MLGLRKIFGIGLACLSAALLPGSAASAAPIKLKMGQVTTPVQVRSMVSEYFCNRVRELTNGEVDIEFYHSGQLGKPREVLEGMQLGTVDFTIEASGLLGGMVPKFNVVYLPFRWRDEDHLTRFTQTSTWKEWTDELQKSKGIRTLATITNYPRQLITVPGPIKTPADLNGLKIRVPESAAPIAIWRALGANPVPVNFQESYQALQQGTVHGAEADPPAMVGISWHEVAKHVTQTEHTRDAALLLVSERTWGRLSESHRAAIMKAAGETQAKSSSLEEDATNKAYERMKAAGVTISVPDRAAFLKLARPAVKEFTDKLSPGTHELIEALISTN